MRFLSLFVCFILQSFFVYNESQAQKVEVKLVTPFKTLNIEGPNQVGVYFKIEKGWHLYWQNPGDSGMAPNISWAPSDDYKIGAIKWPMPERIPISHLINFGYSDDLLLINDMDFPNKNLETDRKIEVRAKVNWLVCQEDCVPGTADVSQEFIVSNELQQPDEFKNIFDRFSALLPVNEPNIQANLSTDQSFYNLSLNGAFNPSPGAKIYFFPKSDGLINHAAPQVVVVKPDGISLKLARATNQLTSADNFSGIVSSSTALLKDNTARAIEVNLPLQVPSPAAPTPGDTFLLIQFLMAFLAGIILNIMPCVFPVLSIKILHLVELSGKSLKKIRLDGLLFAAGVIVSFLLLAVLLLGLKSFGRDLGWGFQMQSPYFIAAMAMFLTVLAFNLLGFFEVGATMQRHAGKINVKDHYATSFIDGVLATLLASPCSAPFMGGALAYGLSSSALHAILIFTALGAGMAAPFLLLAWIPSLLNFLPRPGAWMETFKKVMAFPLFATVAWLAWVYNKLTNDEATLALLVALVCVGLSTFVYGAVIQKSRRATSKRFAKAAALSFLLLGIVVPFCFDQRNHDQPADTADLLWERFSESKVSEALTGGRAVFVDFTASWCITCQVNKKLTLSDTDVLSSFKKHNILLLRADWTKQDSEISKALATYGSRSVPLYVLRRPNGADAKIFPSILRPSMIIEALDN